MDWRSIIFKNTLRSLRRYLGYLLASAVAVTVFFMFAAFVDNPAVQHGYTTRTAAELLMICRVIVALFAVFFIFYFHAALIRMRNKEFGLLITLGVTPRHIGMMIFNESILIGISALIAGIVFGIGCTQVFLWAMSSILALPSTLPFALPVSALLTTLIFFGIVFLMDAWMLAWRVMRRAPRSLILGVRARQAPPRVSLFLIVLGLLCIGVAYDLALQFSILVLLTMIPIIGLTIIGTYFVFSQVCVLLLRQLRKCALHGVSLLIVSRLSYRVRDYARMMTVVTVLNAMVLTGMGAVFGVLRMVQVDTLHSNKTEVEQVLSVMLFAGFFVSCLFFLAAGSSIYFKLFNQQEEDQRQFQALARIGMCKRETERILTRELLLLFFVPVALGILHGGVAMLDLANLLNAYSIVLPAFGWICLVYIACFAIYFAIALLNYTKRVRTAII